MSGKTNLPPGMQASPAGNDFSASLFFNTLPFHYPGETVKVVFNSQPRVGSYRLLPSQVPPSVTGDLPVAGVPPYFYARFVEGTAGNAVPVNPSVYPEIARYRCISRIIKVLAPRVDYTGSLDVEKPEFWCRAAEDVFTAPAGHPQAVRSFQLSTCHRFVLQVLDETGIGQPELLVGYNGMAHILQHSYCDLSNSGIDTRLFRLMVFRRQIRHWNRLPALAHYHLDQVFPVLNGGLVRQLGIACPPRRLPDQYDVACKLIHEFVQKFCLSEEFRAAVPHTGNFREVLPGDSGLLPGTGRRLLFGQGRTHSNPLEGMKRYGPVRKPDGNHFRCFFIYFEQNSSEAGRLHRYLTGNEGPLRMSLFTCLPISYAPEHNIVIDPDSDAENRVADCLQRTVFDPQVIYFAFYISPWPKEEQDNAKRQLYYRIKEMLMYRQVSVQALEAVKLKGDFSEAICTIGCALVAKLGGLPWRPEGEWQKEPVIGFARLRRKGLNPSQHSSAVYFAPGGKFGGAYIYPAGDSRSVAGLALDAFRECRRKHPGVKRLVIHFYRKFRMEEMELLKKMLSELQLDIPVVIASIGRCRGGGLLVFGNGETGVMPPDGTWTRCGRNSYLLNIGGRCQPGRKGAEQVLPLRIDFRCTRPGHLGEAGATEELLDQVYGFTRMHWHSLQPSPLPVTLTFPARLASFLPWFRNKLLPVHGRSVPWFLV